MSRRSSTRRTWGVRLRRAAIAGSAVSLVAGGTAAAVAANRVATRRARLARTDPCGPSGSTLPQAQSMVVTTSDGAHLAVSVAGPGDGPTVVLSHCWTGSRAVWATVARRLVLGGHRVVLYDQRGHGHSTNCDTLPSIPVLGDDLRAVLEATDTHDAVLVGHSMGGMSIQSYAAHHPDHMAERTHGVVLVATAARVLARPIPSAVIQRMMADGYLEWTRRGRVGRAMARRSIGQQAHRAHIDLTLEGLATTTGVARAGFLSAMSSMDLRPALAQIRVPTTVVVGTRDRLTPPRLSRQLVAGLQDAELVVVPGAGHMLPLEAPDRIIDAVRTTAARSPRAGTEAPALAAR